MVVNTGGNADIGNSQVGEQGQEEVRPSSRHECSLCRDFSCRRWCGGVQRQKAYLGLGDAQQGGSEPRAMQHVVEECSPSKCWVAIERKDAEDCIRLRLRRAGARKPEGRRKESSGFYSQLQLPRASTPDGDTHPGPGRLRGLMHAQAHLLIHSTTANAMEAGRLGYVGPARSPHLSPVVRWDARGDEACLGCASLRLSLSVSPLCVPLSGSLSRAPPDRVITIWRYSLAASYTHPSQHIVISRARAPKRQMPSQPQPPPSTVPPELTLHHDAGSPGAPTPALLAPRGTAARPRPRPLLYSLIRLTPRPVSAPSWCWPANFAPRACPGSLFLPVRRALPVFILTTLPSLQQALYVHSRSGPTFAFSSARTQHSHRAFRPLSFSPPMHPGGPPRRPFELGRCDYQIRVIGP